MTNDVLEKLASSLEQLAELLRELKLKQGGQEVAVPVMLPIEDAAAKADPMDPANKFTASGKLTEQGVKVLFRLFDEGKTRHAAMKLMKISFGAADYRFAQWVKLGGKNRGGNVNPAPAGVAVH